MDPNLSPLALSFATVRPRQCARATKFALFIADFRCFCGYYWLNLRCLLDRVATIDSSIPIKRFAMLPVRPLLAGVSPLGDLTNFTPPPSATPPVGRALFAAPSTSSSSAPSGGGRFKTPRRPASHARRCLFGRPDPAETTAELSRLAHQLSAEHTHHWTLQVLRHWKVRW